MKAPRRGPVRPAITMLALTLVGCGNAMGARTLPPLPPGVNTFPSERSYDVRGTTVEEIGHSLRTQSQLTLGERATGYHNWDIQWRYNYRESGGMCAVTDVTIDLTSTITLPRWVDRERADSTVVAQWDAYITSLRRHEFDHRYHSYQAARELSRTIGRMDSPGCAGLTSAVRSTAQRILDRYKRINEDYDADPENGVPWPPDRDADANARSRGGPPSNDS